MKNLSRSLALFTLLASFSLPIFASAQSSGGCSSAGGSCTINTTNDGTCTQSPEGGFYCRPNVFNTQPGGGNASGKGINLGVITPYAEGIKSLVNDILVPVLFAIAFIVFLWGVFKYFILGAADEKSRTEGRQFVLWGIIGLVVIVSLWGLVNLVISTFSLSAGGKAPPTPTL